MKKITKKDLAALLSFIGENQALYLPGRVSGQTNYVRYNENTDVDLDTLKTVKSAKEAFFPQSETLYSVKTEDGKYRISQEELQNEEFVLFGVKGCDMKGIEVLDKVFLSEPVDTFYKARREKGTIVTMACGEPEESCFCKVFGIDCAEPQGDVTLWNFGNEYFWKANTEKGEALTEKCSSFLKDGDEATVDAIKNAIRTVVEKLPYMNLSLEGWDGTKTEEKFNSPVWEELYKPCLACGTCTFVCPTCQCYDVKDFNTGRGIIRFRCWDSCMYSDFTLMAHGNNRNSQKERFRQRFMHKLVYYPENNDGIFGCVGCGRCLAKCPISMNIVKVMKTLGGGN